MGLFLFSLFRNNSQIETILFGVFALIIAVFLVIDLGFFNKKAHKITTKSALYQSIFWVFISSVFGYLVYFFDEGGFTSSIEYFSAYLTEYALSVDNIFVILLILRYFAVKEEYYHKILFWGILGAVVFRGVFIFVGSLLVAQFHWLLYGFGVFLIYSGIKIYFEDSDEKIDPEQNPVMRLCQKYLPMTSEDMGGKFLASVNGKWFFTSLFLVVALIETTDLIFAMDSIPAAFAITQNSFLIYTSNIFAVMGLRAMFFLLAGIIDKFYLLQKGLSIILFFIGAKMLLEIVPYEISPTLSFTVIIVTLTFSIILSVVVPQKEDENAEPES
ncbi:MAG TPA: tellurium resistance protein TerC [Cytophagales bacterium]|jgi:tellurite resistance protein TerC|nr:tellurium resistance protein TerC [Cytophagales bacterium]